MVWPGARQPHGQLKRGETEQAYSSTTSSKVLPTVRLGVFLIAAAVHAAQGLGELGVKAIEKARGAQAVKEDAPLPNANLEPEVLVEGFRNARLNGEGPDLINCAAGPLHPVWRAISG